MIQKAIIFGDTHFPYQNEKVINIIKQLIEEYKFDEIIMAGDIIDGSTLSKFLIYEDESLELWEEIEILKRFVMELKELSDSSKIVLLGDNHFDERLLRYMLEHPEIKNLIKDFEIPVDEKIEYNKPYFPFTQRQIGIIHGYISSKYFAEKYSKDFQHSLIVFHTHTLQTYHAENGNSVYGIGCSCKLNMGYLRNKPTRWRNSFCILNYDTKIRKYFVEIIEVKDGYIYYNGKIYKG